MFPQPAGVSLGFLESTVEQLEVRSLLSSVAVIRWQMTPQIALDPAHGDQPDLPNTPAYVNPPAATA